MQVLVIQTSNINNSNNNNNNNNNNLHPARYHTGSANTAEAIQKMGYDEVARIEGLMQKVFVKFKW